MSLLQVMVYKLHSYTRLNINLIIVSKRKLEIVIPTAIATTLCLYRESYSTRIQDPRKRFLFLSFQILENFFDRKNLTQNYLNFDKFAMFLAFFIVISRFSI